jgi:hypothetical protein
MLDMISAGRYRLREGGSAGNQQASGHCDQIFHGLVPFRFFWCSPFGLESGFSASPEERG